MSSHFQYWKCDDITSLNRPKNDSITAYFACAGFEEYYDIHRADVAIDNVGNSVFFDNETTGARAYLIKKDNVTNEQMAAILNDKIVAAEGRIENGLSCEYFDDTDGRLVKNSTNATTETVTHTVKEIRNIPTRVLCKEDFEVRGEGVLFWGREI